jgi:hypothetical protein
MGLSVIDQMISYVNPQLKLVYREKGVEPALATILPQLGSLPKMAVLTRFEVAIFSAMVLAFRLMDAFLTTTLMILSGTFPILYDLFSQIEGHLLQRLP